MTRLSKKVLLPVAALSLAVVTGATMGKNVSAAESSSEFVPMVQALVDKFDLNQSEVEAVMSQYRVTRRVERRQEHEAQLDSAVVAGQITEAQKTELQEMMRKHQAERQEMRDLSPEERRAEANEYRGKMQDWAAANGVNRDDFMLQRSGGQHGFGMDRHGRMGQRMGYGK